MTFSALPHGALFRLAAPGTTRGSRLRKVGPQAAGCLVSRAVSRIAAGAAVLPHSGTATIRPEAGGTWSIDYPGIRAGRDTAGGWGTADLAAGYCEYCGWPWEVVL